MEPSLSDRYEDCERRMTELAAWYAANQGKRNEATTRLHIIDRLLFDCLAWQKEHVISEERLDGQYADYTLTFPRRIVIVEAKREGSYFELPVGHDRLEYAIPSLLRTSVPLKAAVEQAGGYCQARGVPFAIVTNGHQIVAFMASRNDGLPPYEGTALVYPSLAYMSVNFLKLWNALSRPAIESQKLHSYLRGNVSPQVPPKLAIRLAVYPGTKGRNPFQASMQDVAELVLEDLVSARELEPTFIRECYCQSGALSQDSQISRTILRTRYAALFDSQNPGPSLIGVTDKRGTSPELLAESLARRPILLIGDVGVGKTTFIKHLLYIESESFKQTAIPLYLDLGRKGTLTSDLKSFLLEDIERELQETYNVDIHSDSHVRAAYGKDLGRFQHGIYGRLRSTKPKEYQDREIEFLSKFLTNREEHLRLSLEYLSRKSSRQVVIFLDNTDQRNDRDQEDAFLIAQEISETWRALVFLPLRPETFHASRKRGALTGYHTRAFAVAPPRIDKVLQKRLAFGLKITRGEIPLSNLPSGITVRLEGLQTLMQCFMYSVERSAELVECIDNIGGGNVRLSLELVRQFFGSGHVDTEKIINTFRYDDYIVPLHEFLRAIIYGDTVHFSPDRSPVANLFDVSTPDQKEHFLLPCILGFISAPGGHLSDEGFVKSRAVYDAFQAVGFTPEQIDSAMVRAHRKNLLETSARMAPAPGMVEPDSVRVTSVGAYHINVLAKQFTYMDAMIVDTPILAEDVYHSVLNAEDIRPRLNRAEAFMSYLDVAWRSMGRVVGTFDWTDDSAALKQSIRRIRESLDRKHPVPFSRR